MKVDFRKPRIKQHFDQLIQDNGVIMTYKKYVEKVVKETNIVGFKINSRTHSLKRICLEYIELSKPVVTHEIIIGIGKDVDYYIIMPSKLCFEYARNLCEKKGLYFEVKHTEGY